MLATQVLSIINKWKTRWLQNVKELNEDTNMPTMRRINKRSRKIFESILGVTPTLRDKNYSEQKEENKIDKKVRQPVMTPRLNG